MMIKAHSIDAFFVDAIKGSVMLEASFSLGKDGGKIVCYHKVFTSVENAIGYIENERRDWFLQAIEDYIHHKRHIINATGNAEEKQALLVCLQAYDHYCKKSLETCCAAFIKGFTWFEKILPNPKNQSFESSLHNLNELKKFCLSEVGETSYKKSISYTKNKYA